jgi:UDP-N-acetyl-2-amino-2-deoxyglucuronate dehydrogenase
MTGVVQFAIVGYGTIGKIHAKCLEELPNANLRAVYSQHSDEDAVRSLHHTEFYTDYYAMLSNPEIDAVIIATPNGTHAELGIEAAKAGKHVIVEKPIDISMDKANALIRACRENNVKLSCILQHRFDKSFVQLKEAIDSGQLGQLNFGASHTKWYRNQEYYDMVDWRGTWAMDGGGALMNQSIHYIDMLLYLMGPVEEVYGLCTTRDHANIEVEDLAVATLRFKSGALGIIEGTTVAYPGFGTMLDIYGSEGSVRIENDQIKEWSLKSGITSSYEYKRNIETGASSAAISNQAHKLQIEDTIEAIQQDREPKVNGEEAIKTLKLILAIYETSNIGKPIRL